MNTDAQTNDGGPAFPNVPSDPQYLSWDEGMSLRDYFAGRALAAILQNQELFLKALQTSNPNDSAAITIAHNAFCIADAMISVKNTPSTNP